MIKIENIGKVFNPRSRNRNEVLKGVSFELPEKALSPYTVSLAAARRPCSTSSAGLIDRTREKST